MWTLTKQQKGFQKMFPKMEKLVFVSLFYILLVTVFLPSSPPLPSPPPLLPHPDLLLLQFCLAKGRFPWVSAKHGVSKRNSYVKEQKLESMDSVTIGLTWDFPSSKLCLIINSNYASIPKSNKEEESVWDPDNSFLQYPRRELGLGSRINRYHHPHLTVSSS